jgi:hypothetical protein
MLRANGTIATTVWKLDAWLDSMRTDWPSPGYGGPVVHWWNHSISYRGTGLDWRYEGIVAGYLTLWHRTGSRAWLDKAIRAGNDLVTGQLPSGHFRNSSFERNPAEGGTPHEAAVDIALLELAKELNESDPDLSRRFATAAQRNLDAYWFGQLWHQSSRTLWDSLGVPSFVPNKAATFVEAVLLLAEVTRDDNLVSMYAIPTGERILKMQVRIAGNLLDGAIAQNQLDGRDINHYYPLYVARCIPPLLKLFEHTVDHRFKDGALAAARFVDRVRDSDGAYPQVLYSERRRNRYPRWIAGAGDIVRALRIANAYGAGVTVESTVNWILRGSREDGRIATASGFDRIVPFLLRRDCVLNETGVVGWCDKSFRALTEFIEPEEICTTDGLATAIGAREAP